MLTCPLQVRWRADGSIESMELVTLLYSIAIAIARWPNYFLCTMYQLAENLLNIIAVIFKEI